MGTLRHSRAQWLRASTDNSHNRSLQPIIVTIMSGVPKKIDVSLTPNLAAKPKFEYKSPLPPITTTPTGHFAAAGDLTTRSGVLNTSTHFGDGRNSVVDASLAWTAPKTVVGSVRGQTTVWQSKDNSASVYVEAGRSQVLHGPGKGKGSNTFTTGFMKMF